MKQDALLFLSLFAPLIFGLLTVLGMYFVARHERHVRRRGHP
ncbi:hypothetical protein [Bradyrhizobium pachyrhizi]|nr:hypothetical protein [Bradyrhizobium pachyrhizi]